MKTKGFAPVLLGLLLLHWCFSSGSVTAQSEPPSTDHFTVFLPLVTRASPPPYFGLALAVPEADDLRLLDVTWYYNWSEQPMAASTPAFVPMAYDGKIRHLPPDFEGYLLVFNEPNLGAPNGCGLSPAEAARRYASLRQELPHARLVVGGWSVFASDWIGNFIRELRDNNLPLPEYWHVHAYTEAWITPRVAQDFLTSYHNLTGGTYWITEYGSPAGNLEDFRSMTSWFLSQTWIERVAAYTNRQPADAPWAIGSGVELVKENATLTPIGAYYAQLARQKK
ncbi:MAG TPA: hypothetical protein DEQ80_11440 [Anaerolinea thermolimosa]|uniref:Asl1-like glycosyl hydrolase catalytic domain-containing protein n=1 Tax=Anaerolinea thermolimosa TaxID=229919 RepID=A0A3D1JJ47_9CHLR|nr:hypothetical protein [Anaerolinea thermolimosa]